MRVLKRASTKNPGTRVQIRADRDVRYRYPLTVMGICKSLEMQWACTVLEQNTG